MGERAGPGPRPQQRQAGWPGATGLRLARAPRPQEPAGLDLDQPWLILPDSGTEGHSHETRSLSCLQQHQQIDAGIVSKAVLRDTDQHCKQRRRLAGSGPQLWLGISAFLLLFSLFAERMLRFLDGADLAVVNVDLPSGHRPPSRGDLYCLAEPRPPATLGGLLLQALRAARHRRTSHARGRRRLSALLGPRRHPPFLAVVSVALA